MKNKQGRLRIIGGKWRRRLLVFSEVPGLRPTHDRVRETLFNWLEPYIKESSCLDLFAGSGALGFEALSRGAKSVSFVDVHPEVIGSLKQTAGSLKVDPDQIEIIQGSCPEQPLSLSFAPYHIIFIDPPFKEKALPEIAKWIESHQYDHEKTLLYLEVEGALEPELPGWRIFKVGRTRSLSYFLMQRLLLSQNC